ncbi:MAG: hypothetical protein WBB70_00195 [Desulfobacterales bacterium]
MLPQFAKPLSPLNRHKILRRIVMAKATKEERRNKVIVVFFNDINNKDTVALVI